MAADGRSTSPDQGIWEARGKPQHYVVASSADRLKVPIPYDYLIVATDRGDRCAAQLLRARGIRNRILQAFEQAEAEEDPRRHRDLLTFVLVGAGPTGVELAGALAVLVRTTLRSEFRRIDPLSARIVLVDMANRVLGSFAEELSSAAKQRLERLGVEVRLGHGVDQIDADGVTVAGDRTASRTVIWTAGVAPSAAGNGWRWRQIGTGQSAERSHCDGTSRNFYGGRHRLAPAGRKAAAWRRSGCDAAGALSRNADSPTGLGETCITSVPLL